MIVGWSSDSLLGEQAVRWIDGRLDPLGVPGRAVAITNDGCIGINSGSRALVWREGVVTDLGSLGSVSGAAIIAMNERGAIIGNAANATGAMRAFVWIDGRMIELGAPGGQSTSAVAINDTGDITPRWPAWPQPHNRPHSEKLTYRPAPTIT